MEDILRKIPGVLETEVGYTGGTLDKPDLRAREDRPHRPRRGGARSCSIRRSSATRRCSSVVLPHARPDDARTARATTSARSTARRSSTRAKSSRRPPKRVKAEIDKAGKWKKPVVTEIVAGHAVLPGRGLPPGLPAEEPRRLHLPLPAGLDSEHEGRRVPPLFTNIRRRRCRGSSRPSVRRARRRR